MSTRDIPRDMSLHVATSVAGPPGDDGDTPGLVSPGVAAMLRVRNRGFTPQSFGESPPEQSAAPRVSGYSDTQGLSPELVALLADLAVEFGAGPFTSQRAAALLDRHVRGVGTLLGRAARSGELIAAPSGPARLVRARTVQGRLSLWRFEAVAELAPTDPDEDLL